MRDWKRITLWVAVGLLLLSAVLRWADFGQVPPGLYHDEAAHGLDGLDILQGNNLPIYFEANNGREPLFIYLVAFWVGVLGPSPFALRLAASFVGLLTVAVTVAMGRVLFSRRVGLLAAAVLAVTLWHVHLSRVGFRAVLLPLFLALTVWQATLSVKTGRRRYGVAAGLFYGLSFYTYMAARITPLALLLFGLTVLVLRRKERAKQLWPMMGWAALTTVLVVMPLLFYIATHSEVFLGRPGQVSILNPDINGGDFWSTLGTHTLRTLGMFFVKGDRIWRHNVPWRPVFDPLLGFFFVSGLLVALRRIRRDLAAGLILIWTAVMALSTLLAEDAPHFLRSVGVLPAAVFFPALGLDWLLQVGVEKRPAGWRAVFAPVLVIFVLLFGLGSTVWAYFGEYATDPMAGYWFEQAAVTLAGDVNRFLGEGWDGERMLHASDGPDLERWAYLDPMLWEEWPQVRFLVAAPERVTVGLETRETAGAAAVFVWPYGEWQRAWGLLPHPAEITVENGPLAQGDRDPEPSLAYLAFYATAPDPAVQPIARFSSGVALLEVTTTLLEPDRLEVHLSWRATEPLADDYTIFVHYLRGEELVTQGDARPAMGRYPTTLWQPGDVIHDVHALVGVNTPLSDQDTLLVGFWQPESGARLDLLDEAGNPAGNQMVISLNGLGP